MKRLVKFLVVVAILAVIAHKVREHLVPAPQEPSAEPPRFRVAPETSDEPVAAEGEGDTGDAGASAADEGEPTGHVADLTEVKGIGPVYFGRLVEAGITTLEGLAGASAADVAGWAEVSEDAAADWIDQARQLGS